MPPFRMSQRRTSMLGALLATIGPISMSIYTPAMPELVQAFRTSDSAIKMALSVYFAGFSVAQLLAGPLSDAFGRRAATLLFIGIYVAGSLLAAFAPGIEWLLAGRLIQGIGASVGITVARAIVRDQFTGTEASRIMNLIGIMIAIGPAAAPTIGGLALAAFGWQSVFFLLIGFGLLICLSVVVFMRETSVPDRRRALPGPLLAAYTELARESRFVSASLVLGGSIGPSMRRPRCSRSSSSRSSASRRQPSASECCCSPVPTSWAPSACVMRRRAWAVTVPCASGSGCSGPRAS